MSSRRLAPLAVERSAQLHIGVNLINVKPMAEQLAKVASEWMNECTNEWMSEWVSAGNQSNRVPISWKWVERLIMESRDWLLIGARDGSSLDFNPLEIILISGRDRPLG